PPRRGRQRRRRPGARPAPPEPRRRLLRSDRPPAPRRRTPGRRGELMLPALRAALAKDLRLLIRDRAGLVFLSLAPVVVISVAGFSLAGLFGAPIGGYVLPLADEDHGRLGRVLRSGFEENAAIEVRPVADRDTARALVCRGAAGAALVIPAGASAALRAGQPVSLLLYTDPVKYLEVANVRALVQEARQRAFADWLTEARARAGRFADRLPPPPAPPPVPSAVAALAGTDATVLAERIMPPEELELPHVALPAVPTLPALDFPAFPELTVALLPGSVDVAEASVTGAPRRLNA